MVIKCRNAQYHIANAEELSRTFELARIGRTLQDELDYALSITEPYLKDLKSQVTCGNLSRSQRFRLGNAIIKLEQQYQWAKESIDSN